MKLDNHIAYRFLTDENFWFEIIEAQSEADGEKSKSIDYQATLYNLLTFEKSYTPRLITKTVVEKIDYLKVNRKDKVLDWTVFKDVKEGKYTYIFPDNRLIRICVHKEIVHVFDLTFFFNINSKLEGQSYWTQIYSNRFSGERCEHVDDKRGMATEEYAYKLMCFIHLGEIQEQIIEKGKKWGTRKTGKVINILPFSLIRVDSTWNITSIRTDEFGVKGHFAIRWTGQGRSTPKLVWINPFKKQGYVRKAKKLDNE